MADHNELGNIGEERAQAYLRERGFTIRHTNWRSGKFELDIVAEKEGILIVVEVKTRSTDTFEHPKDAITISKIKKLVNGAHEYIMAFDWQGETRFDVMAVLPNGQTFRIEHIEDAFLPPVS